MLTAALFHSSFVRKSAFYSKNIQYAYNFYWTELYINICRGVFRTQSNIYDYCLWWNFFAKITRKVHCRSSIGSKYASGIGFTVEEVYRISIFIWYGKSWLQKFVITFLLLGLIKKTSWFNSFMTEVSVIKKPVYWFALKMNVLVSTWYVTPLRRFSKESVICYQVFCCCWQVKYI